MTEQAKKQPPQAIITMGDRIDVKLLNWHGVGLSKIDAIAFALQKAIHQHNIAGLQKERAKEQKEKVNV